MSTIPYGRQWVDAEDRKAVEAVLVSDWLTQGPAIPQFERALCAYTGAKYAVTVANGTAALHLAMVALDVKKGDRVLTSPITFAASANCALYAGARPDFIDIDDRAYHMDLNRLKDYLKSPTRRKNVKTIVPVHFMGTVMDMKQLDAICAPYGIRIVEDAAHALGASYVDDQHNLRIGSCQHSDAAIFSFHPIKHITTGEGGAVLTNNEKFYQSLLKLRHHGIVKNSKAVSRPLKPYCDEPWFYDIPQVGYNFRLSDIHSALGLSQLRKIDLFVERRREVVQRYSKAFAAIKEIHLPYERPGTRAAYHLFVIRVPPSKRNALYLFLKERNVTAQINYIPVHLFGMYQKLGFRAGDFPVAEKYFQECLSLPLYPLLSDKEQRKVIDTVLEFFKS